MELIFDNAYSPEHDALESVYLDLMKTAFSLLDISKNYEVDVNIVDEATIQEINRDYRHIDRVTDVISFAFEDDDSSLGHINAIDIPIMLGEIFICLPRAKEQAKEIGNTLERELMFLFVHGLLHLLGYDHMKKEDEEVMFPLQEKIILAYKEAQQ